MIIADLGKIDWLALDTAPQRAGAVMRSYSIGGSIMWDIAPINAPTLLNKTMSYWKTQQQKAENLERRKYIALWLIGAIAMTGGFVLGLQDFIIL